MSLLANELSSIAPPLCYQYIWGLRERLAEALMHDGYCYKYDVSLPLSSFYHLVEDMRVHLGDNAKRVVGFGHVGDGKYSTIYFVALQYYWQ